MHTTGTSWLPTTAPPTALSRAAAHLADRFAAVRYISLTERGTRPGVAPGLDRERRRRHGLHGCRPLHRFSAPSRSRIGSRRRGIPPRHRLPLAARLTGSWPNPEARDNLTGIQPAVSVHVFSPRFRDAQCGFKAVSRRVAHDLAPLVLDNGWFFDSELLILAQKCGFRIREIPVRWTDDPDTRVRIIRTAWEDVKGLLRAQVWRRRKGAPSAADCRQTVDNAFINLIWDRASQRLPGEAGRAGLSEVSVLDLIIEPMQYGFMQRALLVSALAATACGIRRHIRRPARYGFHGRRDRPFVADRHGGGRSYSGPTYSWEPSSGAGSRVAGDFGPVTSHRHSHRRHHRRDVRRWFRRRRHHHQLAGQLRRRSAGDTVWQRPGGFLA